jgi:predicted aldo/keto reductase-like oxidoreductase
VGLVAMKPFAGGKLFDQARQLTFEKWHSGQKNLKLKRPKTITSAQCLSYVLSQAGVSCVVPGCKSKKELADVLRFWDASEKQKDFSLVMAAFNQFQNGECVYCNHCLPCPVKIDIGMTIRLAETAERGMTGELIREYQSLASPAGECTECRACTKRCPFGVEVEPKLKRARELFGS